MKGSYRSLYEFGSMFLGPVLSVYARNVVAKAGSKVPVCLAREGWLFYQLFKELDSEGLASFEVPPVYLKVSRTVLLRAMLGDEAGWEIAFDAKFRSSTVLNLLVRRFGFSIHEAYSTLPHDVLHQVFELPAQAAELKACFRPFKEALLNAAAPTREGLERSFELAGLRMSGVEPLLLDIGYSGTIQRLLTHLFNADTTGLYFVCLKAGVDAIGPHLAKMSGVFHEDVKWDQGHILLDRSLLLESLMTAPHGQVVDVRKVSGSQVMYFYGAEAPTQTYFQDLDAVFRGAIDEVKRHFRLGLTFTQEEVEAIYSVFATTSGAIPNAVRHLFGIDDDFYDNGELSPLKVFGL